MSKKNSFIPSGDFPRSIFRLPSGVAVVNALRICRENGYLTVPFEDIALDVIDQLRDEFDDYMWELRMKEEYEEGFKEGFEKSYWESRKKTAVSIARKMIASGLSFEDIARCTNFTLAQIEELARNETAASDDLIEEPS